MGYGIGHGVGTQCRERIPENDVTKYFFLHVHTIFASIRRELAL